jgi:hypothetical protein
MFEALKTQFGWGTKASLDMDSFHVGNRDDLIHFLAAIASAIPKSHLSTNPYFYIAGGLRSGKSLVAEAMAKTIDDSYSLEDILNAQPDEKYFLEKNACSTGTLTYQTTAHGENISILFKSAVDFAAQRLNHYFASSEFNQAAAHKPSMTILTGWSAEERIAQQLTDLQHKPSFVMDLGRREFVGTDPRTIYIGAICENLEAHKDFQASYKAAKLKFTSPTRL